MKDGIRPSGRDDISGTFTAANIASYMTKFSDLGLSPKVMKAIADVGYDTPTPIQAGAIPFALEGRDVLGIAQTGTGKTAGFTLPMIHKLARGRARARMPRSLVLAPTRELAAQVAENFELYAKYDMRNCCRYVDFIIIIFFFASTCMGSLKN